MLKNKVFKKMVIACLLFSVALGNSIIKSDDSYSIAKSSKYNKFVGDKYIVKLDQEDGDVEISNAQIVDRELDVYSCDLSNKQVNNLLDEGKCIIEKDEKMMGLGNTQLSKNNLIREKYWNKDMIHMIHHSRGTNRKIKIAIIDSGIDPTCELPIKKHVNFVPGEEDVSFMYEDVTGHGTAVAGIIANNDKKEYSGVCDDVELYSAKVLDDKNETTVSQLVKAINWAIDNKVNIINMSLGMQKKSKVLEDVIKRAEKNNILMVAAAGNGGDIYYPAKYSQVIAVGSVDSLGVISSDSSKGEELELVAPGEKIKTAGVYDGVTVASGTSMAAPHISGAAAILMSQLGVYDAKKIRYLMDASANIQVGGEKKERGYGLIDVKYAIDNGKELLKYYKSNKKKYFISNKTDIFSYDTTADITGQWSQKNHDSIINAGGKSLNYLEIKLMRLGSKYVDNDASLKHMTSNPYFHGYFERESDKKKNNYIASYIFITKLAQKGVSVQNPQQGFEAVTGNDLYNNAQNLLNNFLKKNIYDGEGNNVNNQCYLLWGMAIHCASDVFSHSAYVSTTHLKHSDNKADNLAYCPRRFLAAKKVTANIINRYLQCTKKLSSGQRIPDKQVYGTYKEFLIGDSYFKALSASEKKAFQKTYSVTIKQNNAYKLRYFANYMKELGYSNYASLSNQSY